MLNLNLLVLKNFELGASKMLNLELSFFENLNLNLSVLENVEHEDFNSKKN